MGADTVKEYRYTTYFVTECLAKGDAEKEKIYIDDSGKIGGQGTAYYVLDRRVSQSMYTPGTTINLTAREFADYIPIETNESLTLNDETLNYYVIFYYDSFDRGSYTVCYVEADTEREAYPVVIGQNEISQQSVMADRAVLTPAANDVRALEEKGYMLVNRSDSGNAYSPVESYQALKWLDSKGNLHPLSVDPVDLLEEDAETTITYLVQPIIYTITYRNTASSPSAANEALLAATAENTLPGRAGGKESHLVYREGWLSSEESINRI